MKLTIFSKRTLCTLLVSALLANSSGSALHLQAANEHFQNLNPKSIHESADFTTSTETDSVISSDSTTPSKGTYVEGEALIVLSDNAVEKKLDKNSQKLDNALGKKIDVKETYQFTSEDTNETISAAIVSSDSYSTKKLWKKLNQSDEVAIVEPNYIFQASSLANDTYNALQWYLKDDTHPENDIDYESTSQYTPQSTPVVAVVDTGIDSTHTEFTNRIFGTTMYNSITKTNESFSDNNGHGTHIAGIIAAASNNNEGITGIANAQILPIKCLDENGDGSSQSVLHAYYYMIQLMKSGVNLKAINLSLGGFGANSTVLNEVIKTAGELGAITVCSSGNEGADIDAKKSYPASYENKYLISVGASNQNNGVASFSNYGQTDVDVYAPGTNIFSTSNEDDFHPELSHEYSYETFENASADSIIVGNNSGSVSISQEENFSSEGNNSLCWDITTASGGQYYIAIPYQISSTINQNTYLGARLKIKQTSGETTISKNTLTFADSISSNTTTNNYVNDISDEMEDSSDYWYHVRMAVASKKTSKKAGTYYAVVSINATTAASYKIYIDNLGVGTQLCKYTYETGTSMATPVVTGEVALLSSIYPTMSASEIRARVIGGVDTNENYAGKCTSSGKVNFAKALSGNLNPVITDVVVQNTTLQLSGYGFGDQAGTITIYNSLNGSTLSLPPATWTNQQITASLGSLATGRYQIRITRPDSQSHLYDGYLNYTASTYVTQVSLNKSKISLIPGKTYQLQHTLQPANPTNSNVTYTSSNPEYATVTQTGLVKAKAAGKGQSVTITCTAADQNTVFATCTVTIKPPVSKLVLKKKKRTVKAGKKVTLRVTVKPAKASQKVKYTSSKKKYATVSQKGIVTTKKAGKGHRVTITCTATDGSKKKVKCVIKIK